MEQLIQYIDAIDQQLFLFLNGLHTDCMDPVMWRITQRLTWYPLYLLVMLFVLWKYRINGLFIIGAFALVIAGADYLASGLSKPFFERLRPCHNPEINHLVHTLHDYCRSQHGFFSGHATNTFAGAMLFWLLFRRLSRYTALAFLWAAVVAYSRIYVGVHYPGDILAGALAGAGVGWCVYQLLLYILKKANRTSLLTALNG